MQRFYKLIVFFDLPTKTKDDRKNFYRFRKFLIKNGYSMMQYSVYVKTCDGYDRLKSCKAKLNAAAPCNGSVRILTVTQKQYENIEIITGEKLSVDISPEYEQLTIA